MNVGDRCPANTLIISSEPPPNDLVMGSANLSSTDIPDLTCSPDSGTHISITLDNRLLVFSNGVANFLAGGCVGRSVW